MSHWKYLLGHTTSNHTTSSYPQEVPEFAVELGGDAAFLEPRHACIHVYMNNPSNNTLADSPSVLPRETGADVSRASGTHPGVCTEYSSAWDPICSPSPRTT